MIDLTQGSARLHGIPDTHNILKPGHVHVNHPSQGGPLTGEVLVGREDSCPVPAGAILLVAYSNH